jgi:hypothetical protein
MTDAAATAAVAALLSSETSCLKNKIKRVSFFKTEKQYRKKSGISEL